MEPWPALDDIVYEVPTARKLASPAMLCTDASMVGTRTRSDQPPLTLRVSYG